MNTLVEFFRESTFPAYGASACHPDSYREAPCRGETRKQGFSAPDIFGARKNRSFLWGGERYFWLVFWLLFD